MKTYTREELTNLTSDQFNALSKAEQDDVRAQGRAFLAADQSELA
jgi:hypothetical protein